MAQNEAGSEADDQLKKRARRRLVGAVALVLFAVIVLPMVMDREPRPTSPDIQIRIPSQDEKPFDARLTLPKATKSPAPTTNENAAKPQAAEPATISPAAPTAVSVPEPTKGTNEVKVEAPKPTTLKEPKPAEPGKAAADAEAARAQAALSGATPPANGKTAWVVQLGAYRDAGNVKNLLAKVKEMGLPVYTEKFDSPQGPRTRVRAGPFSTREAATKAQARIKGIGVSGPVAEK